MFLEHNIGWLDYLTLLFWQQQLIFTCLFTSGTINIFSIFYVFRINSKRKYFRLQAPSVHYYLELRFNRAVRLFASVCFIMLTCVYLAIVVYAPGWRVVHLKNLFSLIESPDLIDPISRSNIQIQSPDLISRINLQI